MAILASGSTFHIELPLQTAPTLVTHPQTTSATKTMAGDGQTRLSILLADDVEENCFVIQAYLLEALALFG